MGRRIQVWDELTSGCRSTSGVRFIHDVMRGHIAVGAKIKPKKKKKPLT